VVDELGLEKVVLVGHSMGGYVALEAARLQPGRVLGVVGVDTLQDADLEYPDEVYDSFIAPLEADFVAGTGNFVRRMFPEGSDPALVERVVGTMTACPPEVGLSLMRGYRHYDLADLLAAAGVPVRVVNAPQWPTSVENNRKYAPDFDAVIIEGVGHFLMMERPAEFNAALAEVLTEILAG
jgi:pimeloyl-ACP methyl ester carboxylesterase